MHAFVSDMFNFPVTVIVHKYDGDRKSPDEQTEDILSKELFFDFTPSILTLKHVKIILIII